ncbi:MAG TPA: tRNA (adenosine(37)-N6)-threonylcarbamoyltransferase complex ATPase subunit type 1 TsaE [Longimicrobiales bacterium]|nr:tRNA (adenosine(37)-N6)-threonylcarbamoyltransferase complex ATPase subunit type 1 TsaE [Longimicrobiales bacterium]
MTVHEARNVTEAELEAWGRKVGGGVARGRIATPLVLALRGPLGVGKSVLARAVARGAGVEAPMPSPTYNLLFSYEGEDGLPVHHMDLYRLEHPDDVWELGWRELAEGRQLLMVEWPERAESLLPGDRWDVYLDPVPGVERVRSLCVRPHGDAPSVPDIECAAAGPAGDAAEPGT